MNIPLIYAGGSLFHIYMSGENLSLVHMVPSYICIVIWLISSQNPFGVFKKFASFLERKIMRKAYEREGKKTNNDETEIDLDENMGNAR